MSNRMMGTPPDAIATQLRALAGVTIDCAAGRHGTFVATAGEIRALAKLLKLDSAHFATHFGWAKSCVFRFFKLAAATPVHTSRPRRLERLLAVLARARELGALSDDPGTRAEQRKARKQHQYMADYRETHPPRTLIRYGCAQCGATLRRKQLEAHPGTGDLIHDLPDGKGSCGPVLAEDTRRDKPVSGNP